MASGDQAQQQKDDVAPPYRVYCMRHVMMFVYFVPVFTCGFFQNSFAPISDIYEKLFDDTAVEVTMFANIIMILNIPISFLAPSVFERKGLRFGCWVGTLFLLVGGWMRYAAAALLRADEGNNPCWLIFIGQFTMSLGFPLLLSGAPVLSNAWYSSEGRAIATAIGSLAPIIGTVAASVVAPLFFSAGGSHHKQMVQFLLFQALLASLSAILMLMLRNAPPSPPGPRSVQALSNALGKSVLEALNCASFRLLMLVFGCGYSGFNAITTLINQILRPDGFTDDQIGNIGAALGAGILGSFIFGGLGDATKRFSLIARCCATCMLVGYIGFVVISYDPRLSWWWTFAALGFTGFFGIPIVPLIFELGIEVLFPLSESVVGSLLWLSANTIGLTAVIVGGNLDLRHGTFRMLPALSLFGALLVLAWTGMLFFRGEMRRQKFEQQQTLQGTPLVSVT